MNTRRLHVGAPNAIKLPYVGKRVEERTGGGYIGTATLF